MPVDTRKTQPSIPVLRPLDATTVQNVWEECGRLLLSVRDAETSVDSASTKLALHNAKAHLNQAFASLRNAYILERDAKS